MIRLNDLTVPLDADLDDVFEIALKKSGIRRSDVTSWKLARKSVDARDKNRVHFSCCVDLVALGDEAELARRSRWPKTQVETLVCPVSFRDFPLKRSLREAPRPVVVGAGPAGLFAALALAEAGLCPLVIDRGKQVAARVQDVQAFFEKGILNPSSNIQFGEGGAGTFSDGKLNTGIRKDAFTSRVLHSFVDAGAPEAILWESRPHVGTDLLEGVVVHLRQQICALGGEFLFETCVTGFRQDGSGLCGVDLVDTSMTGGGAKRTIETQACFLCIGHSARDTFQRLLDEGIALEPKALSIGVRIEHSQKLINESQYGKRFASHPALGAADYRLALHLPNGRGVYTFCMCPGGHVVAATSEEEGVVTNGMSAFARDGENANSALLVGISPADFGGSDPLAGVNFQRTFERMAFEAGGKNYGAPTTRVEDFLRGRASKKWGSVRPTYRPNACPSDVARALPGFATDALRQALPLLDRKIRGFAHPDTLLTAVETRSSSPVRILRGQNFESTSLRGLFPCGEGAGYAGGITSSATDGLKAVAAYLDASKA